jgi:outer membrane protein TolC
MCGCLGARVEAIDTLDKLPSLDQALAMSEARYSSDKTSKVTPRLDVALEVERNHDLILARREQLEISNEVKGHLEKAVTKAEKKFEKGDADISQSAITKSGYFRSQVPTCDFSVPDR